MIESKFQKVVTDYARNLGWMIYQTRTGLAAKTRGRNTAGFPDLVLIHPSGHVIVAELKTESGVLSQEQHLWMGALWNAEDRLGNMAFRVRLWNPNNMDRIFKALRLEPDEGSIEKTGEKENI